MQVSQSIERRDRLDRWLRAGVCGVALALAVPAFDARAADAPVPALELGAARTVDGDADTKRFEIELSADQGVIFDLVRTPDGAAPDEGDGFENASMRLFDPSGACVQIVRADRAGDACASLRRSLTGLQNNAEAGVLRLAYRPVRSGRYLLVVDGLSDADAQSPARFEVLARQRYIPAPPTAHQVSLCAAREDASQSAACDRPYSLDPSGEKVFEFATTRMGQSIRIDMTSDQFDTILELRGPIGADQSIEDVPVIASDDDGGGDLNSMITRTLPARGRYLIRASTVNGRTGDFTLALRAVPPPPPPPPPRPIADGAHSLNLSEDTPILEDRGHYELFSLSGQSGETVTIVMASEAFDSYLEALVPNAVGVSDATTMAADYLVVASNDDSDGLNSRLTLRFSTAAEIVLRPSALGDASDIGEYTLTISRVGAEQDR